MGDEASEDDRPPRRGHPVAVQDHHGAGASAPSSSGRGGYPSRGPGPTGLPGMPLGLDLSFGIQGLQFENINLVGSELGESAIFSLVTSVSHITTLDLRGNRLSAAFGWRLVKAMKKKYLSLEYCNGVPLHKLRQNKISRLDLASVDNNHCMYGIEVVGAIFLAHFLRLNSSLTELDFRRNHIEKDGAKALAQSLLGNAQCQLQVVKSMEPTAAGSKPSGCNFADFRTSQLTVLNLSKRMLDDDDFVFLEEWLRRYDCVTELDISQNIIQKDGIRKLAKYVKETKTLRKLNATLLPVGFEGSAVLANAVVDNETLEEAALPLGPCNDNQDQQEMLRDFGFGLWEHPSIMRMASNTSRPPLDWSNLSPVRENHETCAIFPPPRSTGWPRVQMLVFMWFMAAGKPHLEEITFGQAKNPSKEYPNCSNTPKELWPGLMAIVHDMHRTLVKLTVALPREGKPVAIELMRVISTKCTQLRTLNLLGYASTPMPVDEARLLQDWTSTGTAPRWLIEEKLAGRKLHWQALYGMLSTMEQSKIYLETFNGISFRGAHEGGARLRDQPELTTMVLMQCLVGVAVDLQNSGGDFPQLEANLTADADVEAFCDVLRLLSKTPMVVIINFTATFPRSTHPLVETIKRQQAQLAGPLSGTASGDQVPRFTHAVVLKNNQVSERLLESLDCHAPLREFCYDHLKPVLPALFKALCSRERPLPVERIRVFPKWGTTCNAHKRFSEKRRRQLEGIHAALLRSDHFQEIASDARGTVSRADVAAMQPVEFAALLSGVDVNEFDTGDRYDAQTFWRYFPSAKTFFNAEPQEDEEELFVPLPLDEDTAEELQLSRLSLCMCDLRAHLASTVRPDEWPASSTPLWDGPRRIMKPGDWDEHLADTFEDPPEADAYDKADENAGPPPFTRFHWREDLRIGTQQAALQAMGPLGATFADGLFHDILRSLLSQNSTLKSLDLRGCGLTRVDAEVIISLLGEQGPLQTLNGIPVDQDEAAESTELRIDGSGIDKPGRGGSEDGMDDDEEEPRNDAFAQEALEAEYVRLDEGDGLIYFEYLKPELFPSLTSLELRRLEVPLDSTLTFVTDMLISMPSLERLHLADLRLTSFGASLLLQAVTQMAPRLQSLNNLPVSQLVSQRDAQEGGALELPESVEWNDFTLGVMAKLQLWPVAAFLPPSTADGGCEFRLRGPSLTDVGLRGLCRLLQHLAEQERRATAPLSRSSAPNLVRIDLSGNLQITDDTVATLCHTLKHQSIGGSLRHSLRELSVRACPRLRTRSSFELLNFVHHVREVLREGAASAKLGSSLQSINGVDLEVLQSGSGRSAVASGRSNGPPMLLRTFAEVSGRPGQRKPLLAAMSECDAHFFAGVLHLYTQIPYCHVHVVVPGDLGQRRSAGSPGPWGMPQNLAAEGGMFQQATVSNASPFPPPQSVERQRVAAAIQAQLDAARRLFEACPFTTQLRLSVVPLVGGVEDLVAQGDRTVLNGVPGTERQGDQPAFVRVKQRLQERARRKRRKRDEEQPRRLYYQNNINSRLLHCCFRTLYGKDDTELQHAEIMHGLSTVSLPSEVDVTQVFGVATSVDMQHLDLCAAHLCRLPEVAEMPVLTHVNLNHNHLGDAGTELLFRALADAKCNVVHVAVASNNIGDEGATTIAASLGKLPRLTSLELCDNFIQEGGSCALADAIAGVIPPEEDDDEEPAPLEPLQVLSLDLRGNRSRELGAKRWAEVIAAHPDLKFLCLAQNGIGCLSKQFFMDLVISAVHSTVLSVLDLQDNFPLPAADDLPGACDVGPPPEEVAEELLQFLPAGEYDPAEVRQAVFIRRHRASAMPGSGEKKGRQPQQGQRTPGTRPQDLGSSVHASPGLAAGDDP